MSIWKHVEGADADYFIFNDGRDLCRFCGATMQWLEISDYWPAEDDYYFDLHRQYLSGRNGFLAIQGLEDEEKRYLACPDVPCEPQVSAAVCPACGWWFIDKQVELESIAQPWMMHLQNQGVLSSLDLADIRTPIREVRSYIRAKYEDRFGVHPRQFEELVASIFQDFGYHAVVTAYTGDGGIDIILTDNKGLRIGVQVKRFRERIKVEQIRSFVGALVLNGISEGYFVTTSSYQSGVRAAIKQAAALRIPVKALDQTSLFDAIGIAQILSAHLVPDFMTMLQSQSRPRLHFVADWHLASL